MNSNEKMLSGRIDGDLSNKQFQRSGKGGVRLCPAAPGHLLICNIGIYGPGYEERRRERIREKYGIDVPSKS